MARPLTFTEQNILRLIATKGLTNREIATILSTPERSVVEKTIKVHVSSLMGKLEVSNRVQAALAYHGLLER